MDKTAAEAEGVPYDLVD